MSGSILQEGLFIQTGNPFTVSESTPFAAGQLGKCSSFPNANDENGVDTGTANIQIQYVKRHASDTITPAAGDLAFWSDTDAFVVTHELTNAVGGATAPLVAGVFGGTSLAAGSYGFIQVSPGIAPVRVSDSTSAATIGVPLVWSTNRYVRQATTADANLRVVGVLKSLNTATGTSLSVEALLTAARLGW